jgi:hypothetical protein
MASFVYQILFRWRRNCILRPINPRISPEKVALGMIRGWEENEGRRWNEETQGPFMQHVLERYMHDTGHSLESPVEIRQKWYKADSPLALTMQWEVLHIVSPSLLRIFWEI